MVWGWLVFALKKNYPNILIIGVAFEGKRLRIVIASGDMDHL